MIRLESVVIAVLGAVLGVVLGIVFGVTLMYALRDEGLEVISIPVGQLRGLPGALAGHRRARGRASRRAGRRGSTCCRPSRPSERSSGRQCRPARRVVPGG